MRVWKRKRAAQVQKEEIEEKQQKDRAGPTFDAWVLQGVKSLPPNEDGHEKYERRPGKGKPIPPDRVTWADQFSEALGQVRQAEADDDRNEGDEILKLAHGSNLLVTQWIAFRAEVRRLRPTG